MTLHVALRIFCTEGNTDVSQLQYAQELMKHFLESFIAIYGAKYVSHNVHLDSYSAFPFEHFMKHLKSFINKPERPLQ